MVLVPALTPALARSWYTGGGPNGVLGHVVNLHRTVPSGSTYTIRARNSPPLTDFDVYFYGDIDDNQACQFVGEGPPFGNPQTGTVGCDARWAVVVMFTGVAGQFRLTV